MHLEKKLHAVIEGNQQQLGSFIKRNGNALTTGPSGATMTQGFSVGPKEFEGESKQTMIE